MSTTTGLAELEALKTKIEALETKNEALEAENEALKKARTPGEHTSLPFSNFANLLLLGRFRILFFCTCKI
jgi:hypothetical protein